MTRSMPHPSGPRIVLVGGLGPAVKLLGVLSRLGLGLGLGLGATACDKDKLKGPEAEVKKSDVKLTLPPVPGFELPPANSDGSHSVKEMRVKGKKLLESDITVKGVVTWVYDCKTALRQPGMTDKDVEKLMYDDQTKCERSKFFIGDTADTPAEKSMWIIDVPRAFTKRELERLKPKAQEEELKNPAAKKCNAKKKDDCPVYEVGDQVEVTGTWKLSSPHGDRNSDGLLVYKKMKNVTKSWDAPEPPPDPNAGAGGGGKLSPDDLVKQKKPG
jgi:hypothetical protein